MKKKIVRNFLTNLKFFIFFEFFSENVLKTLLRGRETTRKKYRIVFEKFLKYVIFFDFGCPSPPITHPSIQAGGDAWYPGGGKRWLAALKALTHMVCVTFFLMKLDSYICKGANFPINRKIFSFAKFHENPEILFTMAYKCAKFQPEWRRWKIFQFGKIRKFSSKNWWIGIFAVEDNFPINRKISTFPTFSKIPKFYLSGPLCLPIFRSSGEGGDFSNKIRWIGKSSG